MEFSQAHRLGADRLPRAQGPSKQPGFTRLGAPLGSGVIPALCVIALEVSHRNEILHKRLHPEGRAEKLFMPWASGREAGTSLNLPGSF